jgi:hypothetical protein
MGVALAALHQPFGVLGAYRTAVKTHRAAVLTRLGSPCCTPVPCCACALWLQRLCRSLRASAHAPGCCCCSLGLASCAQLTTDVFPRRLAAGRLICGRMLCPLHGLFLSAMSNLRLRVCCCFTNVSLLEMPMSHRGVHCSSLQFTQQQYEWCSRCCCACCAGASDVARISGIGAVRVVSAMRCRSSCRLTCVLS